jgi:two-component system OmpR family sensor kinase
VTIRPRTLRGRLVLVLALVTVLVSALVAGFILFRYRSDLDAAIDEGLETRYADVRSALRHAPRPVSGPKAVIIPKTEVFAQVLTLDGKVLAASPRALLDRPVLGPRALHRATRARTAVEKPVPPRAGNARLLAGPERLGAQRVVVVVGSPLDQSTRAEVQLERALAIALRALAVLVVVAGWFVVGAALRPVGRLVSEADALSANQQDTRLSEQGPTELADLARHLNDMLARIHGALEHERAFVDDASHELRTPIAIVRGELELARPLAAEVPAVRDAVESALEEVEHLQDLALNLLVLGRIRATGPPPEEQVDLRKISERAVDAARRVRGDLAVSVSVQGDALTLGDAASLQRAISNLLDNAMRHATAAVEIDIGEADHQATVAVRDDGPGFPDVVVHHAGERFVPGTVDGAGLGLAIVDAIAARHGGHLELRTEGAGGVAILHLPIAGTAKA